MMNLENPKPENRRKDKNAPCTTKPLPLAFETKLAKYALAAGALLALPGVAHADGISYSGPLNETVSNGGSLSFSMVPGAPSFTLSTYAYAYNNGNGNYDYLGESWLSGPGIDTTIPLAPGTTIGPSSSFDGSTTLDYRYEYGYSYTYSSSCGPFGKYTCYYTEYYGPYYQAHGSIPDDNNPYYIGLEFTQGSQTYYGWAEIGTNVGYGYASAELYGYAFDTDGQPIDAGETATPTPEPSTLALLATGAVGVLGLRRRGKKTSKAV